MAHLTGFGLENFRVFKDYTWFDFAPITILVGPNNSGKSSLIKALLLLKDNWQKNNIPYSSEKILSNFQDALFFNNRDHNLTGIKDVLTKEGSNMEVGFILPYILTRELSQFHVPFFRSPIKLFMSYSVSKDYFLYSCWIMKIFSNEGEIIMYCPSKSILSFDIAKFRRLIRDEDEYWSEFNEFYPKYTSETYNQLSEVLKALEDAGEIIIYPFLEKYPEEPYPDTSEIMIMLLKYAKVENHYRIARILNQILELDTLRPAFNSLQTITYIPSFKDVPKRYFNQYDNDVINQLVRVAFKFDNNDFDALGTQDFSDKWSSEFKIPGLIRWSVEPDTKLVRIKIGENFLSDLGIGVSQIVALLLANYHQSNPNNNERLLILEEPETNLHPAFQSKLADMIADSNSSFDNQFIIETHSEYMIRKFQYLVAKGEMKSEDIVIYYFNDPNNIPPGQKQIKKINILEDGTLSDDFGPGFYDEADNLAIDLFNLQKSRRN